MKINLAKALDNKDEAMFVVNGKLISLEVDDIAFVDEECDSLPLETRAYPDVWESPTFS